MSLADWNKLWTELGFSGGDPRQVLIELSRRYDEPHRFYHNGNHIAICLRMAEEIKSLFERYPQARFAIALHDIVYAVNAEQYPRNEEASAAYAAGLIKAYGGSLDDQKRVTDLILATQHRQEPTDPDAKLVVDIDLWCGLGQPYAQFTVNTQNIRQEFAHVPDAVFYEKNHGFLRTLLDRPHLFSTAYFQRHYEAQAWENLSRYLLR